MALVILAEKTKELNWKTLLNNVYDITHCGKLKIFDQNGKLQIFVQKLNFLKTCQNTYLNFRAKNEVFEF